MNPRSRTNQETMLFRTGILPGLMLVMLIIAACETRTNPPAANIEQTAQTSMAITAEATKVEKPQQIEPTTVPSPEPIHDIEPLTWEPVQNDQRGQQMVLYLRQEWERGNFMGTVLVAQQGELLVNEGFGQADVQAGIPNHAQTQLRIGSLTKQFTAAAILKLQEQGLLDVHDPVSRYLPDYPRGGEISIHQLLTHTAGIPNYEQRPDLPEVVQSPIDLDDLIATFADQPLEFPPGQQFQYSSSGYIVLTKIIEQVSGLKYADFLERYFFTPLQMTNTGYDFLSPELPNPATGYQLTPGGPRPAILTDSSWPTGAGALYSTVEDLYRWDRALYREGILSRESLAAFFTPYVDTRQSSSYGYGLEIGRMAGRPSLMHGGGIFGFASFMARFPDDDAVIIVLSNGLQMPPRIIAESLAKILFEK